MNPATLQSAGLLVLRLVVGTTFLLHGLDKLSDLSYWEQFFASQSIPAPAVMAPFIGATETVGGVLLLAGASLTLALAGPGRYSVDAVSGLRRQLNVDAAVRLTRRLSRGSRASARRMGTYGMGPCCSTPRPRASRSTASSASATAAGSM
jgi:hypothetical protein